MPRRRPRPRTGRPWPASACSWRPRSSATVGRSFGGVERGGEPPLLAVVARAVPELRPADAGRAMAADQLSLGVLTGHLVAEHVLGGDDRAFHPPPLRAGGNA